jgi:DNA (cytosine-5)-methyltransferase 3A
MKIISLFDGHASGKVALDRAGIEVETYYASEIDKYAMKVANYNHPDIIQLGDVTKIAFSDFDVDLIMGGSPCTSFSFSGKMQGFDGESKLFWEFVRAVEEANPKYFFLENVKMKKEWQDIISGALGVKPILVNSALVSAQNRERLYWTNIPNFVMPEDRGILLKDILEDGTDGWGLAQRGRKNDDGRYEQVFELNGTRKSNCITTTNKDSLVFLPFTEEPYNEKYQSCKPILYTSDKFRTLRANAGSRTRGIGICNEDGWWRKLTVTECERLQTLPDGYTSVVSPTQAYKMLGNGWTVDVIVEFFKNLK